MPAQASLSQDFSPASRQRAYRFVGEPAKVAKPTAINAAQARQLAKLQAQVNRLQQVVKLQASTIDRLHDEAHHDALTGLTNRRGFDSGLATALADSERYGYKGALITIDLNHFKTVNDTLGHAAGDALLRHVAILLGRFTRKTDLRARLGGDEFAIILKEASAQSANTKAHQLAALFDENPCLFNGKKIPLSASLGVASFHESTEAATLCRLADQRMYAAKEEAHVKARVA